MTKQWIALAAITIGICLTPLRSAAQGPQGVGAGEAARAGAPNHNPLSWLKKKPLTPTEVLDANSSESAKLTTKLQTQGLLPAGADLHETCETFKDLDDCVATLHAAHNLGWNFNCLKSKVTGVQVGADTSACSSTTDGKPLPLTKALHALDSAVDSKGEANQAVKQSHDDLSEEGLS